MAFKDECARGMI
ncbi:hypothetical protein JTE90_008872, partial [Oedothorax gibbosus]